jgi:O-antigen biosynthesis protein WbqP
MPVGTGDMPSASAGSARVTKVGKLIRRTNIDELPQLFNVVEGDMSPVGPRPALPTQRQLCEYRAQNGALACKPGLTGLAQINSYDRMPEREKAEWDGRYASSVSVLTDIGIVVRTFSYLLKRPPVY